MWILCLPLPVCTAPSTGSRFVKNVEILLGHHPLQLLTVLNIFTPGAWGCALHNAEIFGQLLGCCLPAAFAWSLDLPWTPRGEINQIKWQYTWTQQQRVLMGVWLQRGPGRKWSRLHWWIAVADECMLMMYGLSSLWHT